MKWSVIILMIAIVAISEPVVAAKRPDVNGTVPKYNSATEATFKGTVEEMRERLCPVSGGLGSHVILKLSDGKTIEVHLAAARFVNIYEMTFKRGDQIEVMGAKVNFEGVDTIFAREVRRGNETFVFRDKEGKPIW